MLSGSSRMNRRHWLQFAGAFAAGGLLSRSRPAVAALRPEIKSTQVISHQPNLYHGWPTLTRRRNGELLLVYSGGREAHVCPFGRVELMRSQDDGQMWTWPRVLMDGPIDDRDSGILETAKGSILVTTFTSLAFERSFDDAKLWPKDKRERWLAVRDRINPEQRKKELGVWMIRSTDGGASWSARYNCLVNSPHGPIQLSDGRVLYAGKDDSSDSERKRHGSRIGVCESTDDGQSWRWLATIPTRQGDNRRNYHELHAVETSDGRIIAHIRNHNKRNNRETLQTESSDGGKNWSVPHEIGVWGCPSHLLRLQDDRLLMSHGHRRPPYGNQARISKDHGRTWSQPIIISGDGQSADLGYPSTVQLDDGSFLTVWYELMKGSTDRFGQPSATPAVLRQARWRLNG